MPKNAKTFIEKLKQRTPELLISLGVFLLVLNGVHSIVRDRALRLHENVVAEHQAAPERPAEPARIFIQWFVDVGIEPAQLREGKWSISPDQASYLTQSARPGEPGNIILYGHNFREVLGNIRALKGGEVVTLTTTDGTEHQYRVTELQEVSPSQTDWLQPTDHEVLTLYTCSGLLDSQRFVVRAEPI